MNNEQKKQQDEIFQRLADIALENRDVKTTTDKSEGFWRGVAWWSVSFKIVDLGITYNFTDSDSEAHVESKIKSVMRLIDYCRG